MISDIPWGGPVGAVRIGRINGERAHQVRVETGGNVGDKVRVRLFAGRPPKMQRGISQRLDTAFLHKERPRGVPDAPAHLR